MKRDARGDQDAHFRQAGMPSPLFDQQTLIEKVGRGFQLKAASNLFASTAIATVLGAVMATIPGLLSWDEALAACINTGGSNFVCSGANATTQNIFTGNAVVTTAPGFSINAAAGNGLDIRGNGTLSYIDNNASAITGNFSGIVVNPMNAGSLTIQTGGAVTGLTGFGIQAANFSSGASSVTANGTVTGGIDGISAINVLSSTDLTVTAATVIGARIGIYAQNAGSGATRVTATGAVSGTNIYGIVAINGVAALNPDGTVASVAGSSATDLTINAAAVSGGVTGIYARNSGTGSTGVTATGLVAGGSQDGARILNDATAVGGMAVNLAGVSGGTNGVFVQNAGGGVTNVTATGTVTGSNGNGIDVSNTAAASTGLTVNVAEVNGSLNGAVVSTAGSGATQFTATGKVTGAGADGISIFNNNGATDLIVNAAAVSGRGNGITATNNGSGATRITATGGITAEVGSGIAALQVHQGTDLSVNATSVAGFGDGIRALNSGGGVTSVTATGDVSGTQNAGIFAVVEDISVFGIGPSGGTRLTISAVNASGGKYGIYADNWGVGPTSVTATGVAMAASGTAGIFAFNEVTATGLAVKAASAAGGTYGIAAINNGTGATSVTATGQAEGGFAGILAVNGTVSLADALAGNPYPVGPAGTDLTVNAAGVSGGAHGIYAVNNGTGATRVTATGAVRGQTQYGILAVNDFSATDLTVNAASVSGITGILVQNDGSGATRVTATGTVTGSTADGINVFSGGTTTGLTVIAASVSGKQYGVNARGFGNGATSITTSSLIEGGTAAIKATSAGQPITITSNGFVRNLSQLSTSLAVDASGGPVAFTNAGGMTGTVKFGAGANNFNNNATWNTAGGTNDFGGGASTLTNAAGVSIFAAVNGGAVENTAFNGLANFRNNGVFSMMDGGAGDRTTTSGNARFEAGSIYAVDISGAGQSDRFIANGTVTLTAGSALAVNIQGGLVFGSRYTVLTANGGVSGTFGSVTGLRPNTAFLSIVDTYDANNAYLDVIKYRNFADAGLTLNQISTGRGLDTIPTVGPLFTAVVNLATDAQARSAFDQLSGEVHSSAQSALIDDSRFVRNVAADRIRSAFAAAGSSRAPVLTFADSAYTGAALAYASAGPGAPSFRPAPPDVAGPALWGQGFGSWGHVKSDGNAARLSHTAGGFLIGGDVAVFDTWRLGLMAGYSRSDFQVRDRASSGFSDNYHLGLYGGTQWGALGFRTGAAYTWHDISTSRSVAFPGFSDSLKGDYNAGTAQAFGELGYGFKLGNLGLEPFANLAYVNLRTNGFTEKGGAAALHSQSTDTGFIFTTLGLHVSSEFTLGSIAATARGTLGWRHAFGDTRPLSTFSLAGGSPFTIAGVPIGKDAFVLDAGLDFAIAKNATLDISYGGQFSRDAVDHSVRGGLTVRF